MAPSQIAILSKAHEYLIQWVYEYDPLIDVDATVFRRCRFCYQPDWKGHSNRCEGKLFLTKFQDLVRWVHENKDPR